MLPAICLLVVVACGGNADGNTLGEDFNAPNVTVTPDPTPTVSSGRNDLTPVTEVHSTTTVTPTQTRTPSPSPTSTSPPTLTATLTATPSPNTNVSVPVADILHGTIWRLVSLDGEAVADDTSITLEFTDNRVGVYGMLVCNLYTIYMVPTSDGTIIATHGPGGERWVMTEAGCTTPSLTVEQYNAMTDRYLATLKDTRRFEIDGEILRLVTADGRILIYVSASTAHFSNSVGGIGHRQHAHIACYR